MATLLYTILGITAGASLHCAVRREISPCTCAPHDSFQNTIHVTCERVDSFSQVSGALKDKFSADDKIWLKITHSQLEDLEKSSFADMNMKVNNLKLNHDNLSSLNESTFKGLGSTQFLSLSDNNLSEIPRQIFNQMPHIGTLDLARGKIKGVTANDFKSLIDLGHLVLAANQIAWIEKGAIPSSIVNLHIGKNNLKSLNGTLRNLSKLKLLFVNANNLTSLDDELPENSLNLRMVLAQQNSLQNLPESFKTLPNLNSLYVYNNELKSLGGVLKHATVLERLIAYNNKIEYLADDEFLEAENIDDLQLGYNSLKSLNGSLLPIKHLRIANFTNNQLSEFSLQEISGLRSLSILDLSYNRIEFLTGSKENLIEPNSFVIELRLEHNLLKSLDGALMGLNKLKIIILSYNQLQQILPDDLIGLEELEILDISNNELKTLEETSKTFLPRLKKLNASFNQLTSLERDFHGLPVLCLADLSNNMISTISPDLVANTRCINHGVANKLEIFLKENPVLCDDNLPVLISAMEFQQARLLGVAHCLVPQQMSIDPPILLQAQHLPQIIKKQIQVASNAVMQPPPSIVQVIMPPQIIVPTTSVPIIQQQQPATISTTTQSILTEIISQQIPISTTTKEALILASTTTITPPTVEPLKITVTHGDNTNSVISEEIASPTVDVILEDSAVLIKLDDKNMEPEEPPEIIQDTNNQTNEE